MNKMRNASKTADLTKPEGGELRFFMVTPVCWRKLSANLGITLEIRRLARFSKVNERADSAQRLQ